MRGDTAHGEENILRMENNHGITKRRAVIDIVGIIMEPKSSFQCQDCRNIRVVLCKMRSSSALTSFHLASALLRQSQHQQTNIRTASKIQDNRFDTSARANLVAPQAAISRNESNARGNKT